MQDGWADVFFKHAVDSECEPSASFIRSKDWHVRIAADCINPMFSEWIADAASRFSRSLCGISFEYCGNPQAADVRIDRDSIQKFFSSTSHCFSILTTRDEQFIVYKEESNGYFLIAGTEDFVNGAFRCAEETVIELFQWAVDNLDRNELYRIWNKYNEQKLEYTS